MQGCAAKELEHGDQSDGPGVEVGVGESANLKKEVTVELAGGRASFKHGSLKAREQGCRSGEVCCPIRRLGDVARTIDAEQNRRSPTWVGVRPIRNTSGTRKVGRG
jgi:hypothetical protein